jgi:hypothetical protein
MEFIELTSKLDSYVGRTIELCGAAFCDDPLEEIVMPSSSHVGHVDSHMDVGMSQIFQYGPCGAFHGSVAMKISAGPASVS